jgi:hypothetical protein
MRDDADQRSVAVRKTMSMLPDMPRRHAAERAEVMRATAAASAAQPPFMRRRYHVVAAAPRSRSADKDIYRRPTHMNTAETKRVRVTFIDESAMRAAFAALLYGAPRYMRRLYVADAARSAFTFAAVFCYTRLYAVARRDVAMSRCAIDAAFGAIMMAAAAQSAGVAAHALSFMRR